MTACVGWSALSAASGVHALTGGSWEAGVKVGVAVGTGLVALILAITEKR